MSLQIQFIIITGGPGGGKSTLIQELKTRGYDCVDEVARELIQKEVERDGGALPWKNQVKFMYNMFDKTVEVYEQTLSQNNSSMIFFDRGILDVLAYANLIKAEITEEMEQKAKALHYHHQVFVTPPWEEIYRNDEERKQTFEEAIETYEQMIAIYQKHGYQTIDLPKSSVKSRVEFLLNQLKNKI